MQKKFNSLGKEFALTSHPQFKIHFLHCLKFRICYHINTFHDAHNTCDIINTWQAKHMHEKASTMCNKYMWHMHARTTFLVIQWSSIFWKMRENFSHSVKLGQFLQFPQNYFAYCIKLLYYRFSNKRKIFFFH